MILLSKSIMETLLALQKLPVLAYANVSNVSYGCRDTCAGSCAGSCAGDCEGDCAGTCEESCAGDCVYTCNAECQDTEY